MAATTGNPAQLAAALGQGGDSEVGHLTPGEIIVPLPVQKAHPELVQALAKALQEMGVNPGQYSVGGPDDAINPETGMPQFDAEDSAGDNMSSGGGYGGETAGDHSSGAAEGGGSGSFSNDSGQPAGATNNWGPQNPDALGNSQYGFGLGSYNPDGSFQVGSPGNGFGFGSFGGFGSWGRPGYTDFSKINATPTYEGSWGFAPGTTRGLATDEDRTKSLSESMNSMHGNGFMGSMGRGLEGMFGISRNLEAVPGDEGRFGVGRDWNPGSLAGLAAPGIGGMVAGALGKEAYSALGGKNVSLGVSDPLGGPTTGRMAQR